MANTTIYFSPINTLRFTDDVLSFLDRQDFDEEQDRKGFYKQCYAHKISPGDPAIVIQMCTDYVGAHEIQFLNRDDNLIGTAVAGVVKATVTGGAVDYDIVEFELPITTLVAGEWYRAQVSVGAGARLIQSEWINFGEHKNSELFKFTNDLNKPENFFSDGFMPWLRLDSQIWKRTPTSERSYYTNSSNQSLVVAQRNFRKVTADIYNVPPFIHEMLSNMASLSTIRIQETDFVSEEGLEEPEYRTRFLLANSTLILVQKKNFRIDQYGGTVVGNGSVIGASVLIANGTFYITDDNGQRLKVTRR